MKKRVRERKSGRKKDWTGGGGQINHDGLAHLNIRCTPEADSTIPLSSPIGVATVARSNSGCIWPVLKL